MEYKEYQHQHEKEFYSYKHVNNVLKLLKRKFSIYDHLIFYHSDSKENQTYKSLLKTRP